MRDFKVKTADLPPEGKRLDLNLPAERLEERLNVPDGEVFVASAPLTGWLKLEPSKEKVIVRGKVETVLKTPCSRCLEDFDLGIAENVMVVFSPRDDSETKEELEADELSQELFSGEVIDLWPTIEEHLMLGLPIKPLCGEDCKGLCSICGRNLNTGQCQCRKTTSHPGFAALEQLKDKLPK